MNFKHVVVGLVSVTAVAAGSLVGVSPANALGLKDSFLSVEGSGKLTNASGAIGTLSTLDFLSSNIGAVGPFSDGGFIPFIGSDVALKDITLKKVTATTWELFPSTVTDFFKIAAPCITYKLENFNLEKLASGNFEANFDGIFFGNCSTGVN